MLNKAGSFTYLAGSSPKGLECSRLPGGLPITGNPLTSKEDDAMAKTVTPSVDTQMTDGQIDKAGELFRSILKRFRAELPTDAVQQVLGNNDIWPELYAAFRKRVEMISNMILRHVTTDGRTGEQFIATLESASYNVGDYAKQLLRSDKFVSTNGKTYKLVVIKGDEFEDNDRITSKIREEAKKRGYLTPPVEVAPLLREAISDEELEQMGLWWLIVMHEPITVSGGGPGVLGLGRRGRGRWLRAYHGRAAFRWHRGYGFVFLVPQD